MGKFDTFTLLKWLHFVAFSAIGGGAIVALLLSGFEDEREDLRGLSAAIWKRTVAWGARLAVLLGIGLLVMKYKMGMNPFLAYYLHTKLLLVVIMLGASEMAPKHLALGKRGAAMVTLLMFLAITFVTFNKSVFGTKVRPADLPPSVVLNPGS